MSDKVLSLKKEDFFCLAETILKQGNCIRFSVEGFSMSPSIKDGDIIKIGPVTNDITSGDIIFYRSEGNTAVVHRAVKKLKKDGKEIIITKGDSASYLDSPISSEQVLGKVIAVERNRLQISRILNKVLHKLRGFIRLYNFFMEKYAR